MVMSLAELYVAGIVVVGFGMGLWLQIRMQNTGQLAITPPSPFKEKRYRAIAIMEDYAHA